MFRATEFNTRDVIARFHAEAAEARLARLAIANRPRRPSRVSVLRSTFSGLRASLDLTPARPASPARPTGLRLPFPEEMPG